MSKGTGDKLKGRAQEALGQGKAGLGKVLGNEQLAGEGQADQVRGNVTQAQGAVKDTLADVGKTIGRLGRQHHD